METGLGHGRAGAYQSVAAWSSVASEDPQRLILMLYDGALQRIAAARGCMSHGLAGEKSQLITRALAIVGELRGTLDLVRGGAIAANLDGLYEYIARRLVEANASNQPELLDEVSGLLRELREAWGAIAGGSAKPAA
jgi:flagellar secretion chaperone FliS